MARAGPVLITIPITIKIAEARMPPTKILRMRPPLICENLLGFLTGRLDSEIFCKYSKLSMSTL